MSRPLRIEYEEAFYHIVQRGIERKSIFKQDTDKERFLHYIEISHDRYQTIIHTYNLMDNHYHLIVETPKANLSKVMHYLNASYAAYYNTKYKRIGPLYQGRYKAILVQEDVYLHHLSRYIHLNPVRAGMVNNPEEYEWSSCKYFTQRRKDKPEWLETGLILLMLSNKDKEARELYRRFLMDEKNEGDKVIKENTHNGFILGNAEFLEKVKSKYIRDRYDYEIPKIKEVNKSSEPKMAYLEKMVKKEVNGDAKLERKLSIYLARKFTSKSLREIAEHYAGIGYTGVSQLFRRIEEQRKSDREFNAVVERIEKCVM